MANKVTIDVEARFIDNVSGEANAASSAFKKVETTAKAATKEVDALGKKAATPKLDANTDKFKKAISDSDKKLSKFGKTKAEAKLVAEDKATSVVTRALNKLKSFGKSPKAAILAAKDLASAKIANAISKAKNFSGKTYSALLKIRDTGAWDTIRKVTAGAEKFVGKTWTAMVKVKDFATAPLRGIKNMLFSIKSLVLAVTAGLAAKQLVLNPINLADQYSSAKIGFSTLMGETAGQQMMDELDAFANKTPFKTSGVIGAAQKMMAMGWAPEDIIGDLEVLGNAAAATGNLDQGLESIVRAMSQIKTKGKLSTEELNQLAEAGIAAKAMLAEAMGYGTGDAGIAAMTKDLESGAIASDAAIDALLTGMQRYNGMMDSMANETVEGLKSQLEDTFEINVFRKWGQGLQSGAKKGFGTVLKLLEEAEGALSEFGDMLFEIGDSASQWVADKFQNVVDRILKITDTFEFQNASLGEKISMLWKGAISDPLKEWWEGGGQQKTAETAGKIGKWIGETLTKGILALLGMTDILEPLGEGGKSEQAGMSIAQSFAKGFTEAFDVSAITDKLVEAISNVWGALPTWAKILIGGYAAGKVMGGIGTFAGGIANFAGGVGNLIGGAKNAIGGFSIASSAFPILTSSGTGILGLAGKTGVALGASTAGSAMLMGSAGLAGGIAGGAALIKGGYDLYKGYTTDDEVEAKASKASGWTTIGGVGAGAAAGAAIGSIVPVVGTALGGLIGAGVGGMAGWLGGNAWADDIRETAANAKYANEQLSEAAAAVDKGEMSAEELNRELEKYKWEKARQCFGDISLSMEEIARLSKQVVFGDDIPKYEKFAAATQQAEASLQSLNTAGQQTDRWLWKAGLGVKFNEDEVATIKASFDEYIATAKGYVENKHYEFTASAELLLDLESPEGKAILEGGNAYYAQIQEELNTAGDELGQLLIDALADGFINAEESEAIAAAQKKIADITKQIADAESDAELTLIDLKFGAGKLDADSFAAFMEATQTALDEKLNSTDAAVQAQIANLNLRFPESQRNSAEYKKQLQAIIDSYNLEVESVTADILGVELNIIADAFRGSDMLGADAMDDLQKMLQTCLDEGIEPIDMDVSRLIELSGNPNLGDENAELVRDYLQGLYDQLDLSQFEIIEVDGKLQLNVIPDGATSEKVKSAVDSQVPNQVDETVNVNVTGQKVIATMEQVMPEDFNIPESIDQNVIVRLNAAKTVQEQVDIFASEFGISETEAETILWKLTGEKNVLNKITVTADDFGIPDSVNKTVSVNITGTTNYLTSGGSNRLHFNGFRGGIFGGTSAMGSYARGGLAGRIKGFSDGGMVRGGSQLIEVAEEGSPEMVIPLSSQRRGRALKLWAQAGNIMGVPGFARGGMIGRGGSDEGIRFHSYGEDESAGGQSVQIEVGGITVEIHVNAGSTENIAEAIKAQANEIAETVAGIMADAMGAQFENTSTRGGVA